MKVIIPKDNNDPDGYAFQDAYNKARYIYPAPDNKNVMDTIYKHALQIYNSEMLERSLCAFNSQLKPLTHLNVLNHYKDSKMMVPLMKEKTPYRIVKHKKNYDGSDKKETKLVSEFNYEFNDIFCTTDLKIIECKTYKDRSGRQNRLNKIRSQRPMHLCDYYLLAHDKNEEEFEVTDFYSLRSSSAEFVNEESCIGDYLKV